MESASSGRSGHLSRKHYLAVAVVATVVVVAGGFGYSLLKGDGQSHHASPAIGNGETFVTAWGPVNSTIQTTPGSPWHPVSVLGVALEERAFPLPAEGQYVGLNSTMSTCEKLNGVSVWNSSAIPVFTGNLSSGAAPFWSFVLTNSSGSFLYVTTLMGVVHVYPASVSTPCLVAAGAAGWGLLNMSVVTDSSAASWMAYSTKGGGFARESSPLAEYYVLGGDQLLEPDASPFGWVVNYFRCDQVGVAGLQNYTAVGVLTSGNRSSTFIDNGWLTCTVSNYTLAFSLPVQNVTPPGTTGSYLSVPFQVAFPANHTTFYDGWGLLSWMFGLNVSDTAGARLSAAPAPCSRWVPSLSDCPSNVSGWFAVLLSANGQWLDSFPSAQSPTNWTIPNQLVTSHDSLVIVLPSGWSVSGDTLTVASPPSAPVVSGSATL